MKTIFDFRAFLNFLGRNKLYTAINIFGFSISLMFVILLVTYTRQEYAVDQFHSNKERIFRLCDETDACFAPLIGRDLKARYRRSKPTSACLRRMRSQQLENAT